jgi:hypothetical protein
VKAGGNQRLLDWFPKGEADFSRSLTLSAFYDRENYFRISFIPILNNSLRVCYIPQMYILYYVITSNLV